MKKCCRCKINLPLDQFCRDFRYKDETRFIGACKQCKHIEYRNRYNTKDQVESVCKNCGKLFRFNQKVAIHRQYCSTFCAGSGKAVLDYSVSHRTNIQSWIDGFLLGDITVREDGSFQWNVKHKEFADFIADKLSVYSPYIKKGYNKQVNGKITEVYTGRTHCHPDIKFERNRWYPYGTKIVPPDVTVNKESLLCLYLGDGHLHKIRGWAGIATLDFTKIENEFLCAEFSNLGPRCRSVQRIIKKTGKHVWSMYYSRPEAEKLLELLGASPIECYDYKFQMPDRKIGREYQRLSRLKRLKNAKK